jgi:hypothetical protein
MADWTSLLNGLNSAALDAFGREVTYSPQTGAPVVIRAVFNPTREAEENAPGVYGVIFVQLADLPQAPERGDRVTVGGSPYTVFNIEGDASGAAVLRVRKV